VYRTSRVTVARESAVVRGVTSSRQEFGGGVQTNASATALAADPTVERVPTFQGARASESAAYREGLRCGGMGRRLHS
jgi:hypothetical protein